MVPTSLKVGADFNSPLDLITSTTGKIKLMGAELPPPSPQPEKFFVTFVQLEDKYRKINKLPFLLFGRVKVSLSSVVPFRATAALFFSDKFRMIIKAIIP